MITGLRAAELGDGAVIRRNGLKCVKKGTDDRPWMMRSFGWFDDATIDQWIGEGAEVEACCGLHGVGDHDFIEHAKENS